MLVLRWVSRNRPQALQQEAYLAGCQSSYGVTDGNRKAGGEEAASEKAVKLVAYGEVGETMEN
jgi:hypothetical protein